MSSTVAESDTGQALIEYAGIGKTFWSHGKEILALRDVSFAIRRNEFTSVVGPSGCGKTTLLRLIAGLEVPSSGTILYRGTPVTALNTDVGYVTQESNLYPWMTLRENVEFPLEVRGVPADERRTRSDAFIRLAGLQGFEDHYPYQLSGGMQKRASIIRTMIYDPEVILMDEPFGALDAQTRMRLQADLLRIWSHRQQTILFITHDLTEAIALSDRIVVMSARPGTVKQVFQVPLSRPRDVYQIHAQPGFAEVYAQIWEHFQPEVARSDDGVTVQTVELPPPLARGRGPEEQTGPRDGGDRSSARHQSAVGASMGGEIAGGGAVGTPARTVLTAVTGRAPSKTRRPVASPMNPTVLRVLIALAILGAWQLATELRVLNPVLFSHPVAVVRRTVALLGGEINYSRTIYEHLSVTLQEMAIGYVIGAVLGIAIGFLLARSDLLARVFEPYILAVYSVPKIALAPLFILVLGIGMASKIGVVAMEVFFLVFFNTFSGARNTSEEFVQLAKIMGASGAQLTRRVFIPAALPFIMVGLKMGVPFAMIGAIIGEFMASNQGLGWFILYTASNFDASAFFASLIILVSVVWAVGQAVALAERRLLPWRPTRQGDAPPA